MEGGAARGFMRLGRATFLVLLVGLGLATGIAGAEPKRVLVVHSVEEEAEWMVPAFVNLLGHFDCAVTTLPATQYGSGKMSGYQAVCYLGAREEKLPRALLSDVYDAEIPVCWVGENLDQLANRYSLGRYGFRLTGKTPQHEITVDRPELCAIVGEAKGTPYAVRSGEFWYFAERPWSTGWTVLADQWHDVLGEDHRPRRTAFLCLSEINPLTDPRAVRTLVRTLTEEHVPFAVAVTPIYRDPARERDLRLLDKEDLVRVLREAQKGGAAIISLGLTYQSAKRTGEEAEFWDEERHAPLLERSSEDTHRRIDLAINELAACGLYPVAWATPRGLATPADYAEMAQSFSTVWESRLPGWRAPGPQFFPYLIARDGYGQRIVPGSPSVLNEGHSARALREGVSRAEVVRDVWSSFAIAPDAPTAEVKQLVSGLRRAGWEFADLRRMDNWVKSTPLQIYTRAQDTPLGEVIPAGWNATLFLQDGKRERRFERAAKEGYGQGAKVPAGAIAVAYPPGVDLEAVFLPGGPVRHLTHVMAQGVMRAVTLFAIGACLLFLALYLVQVALQRRRA